MFEITDGRPGWGDGVRVLDDDLDGVLERLLADADPRRLPPASGEP